MGSTLDVVIIGGGVAGLSAALLFGRSLRKVLVVDGGEPRNRFAHHSHGFFTRDGTPPLELLEIGRSQLLPYPSVQLLPGFARSISGTDGHFTVQVEKKEGKELQEFSSRKILLATGVRDLLPEFPGLRELWGGAVFHCPYCHGWEVRGQKMAVLCELPVALDFTLLLRGWSKDITFLSNGPTKLDEAGRKTLEALKIPVIETKVTKLEREGTSLKGVILEDGSQVNCTAMLFIPPQVESSGLAEALGCAKGPTGHLVTQFGKTSVAGIFATGDVIQGSQAIGLASGRGVEAAIFLNKELSLEDVKREVAAGAN